MKQFWHEEGKRYHLTMDTNFHLPTDKGFNLNHG